MGGSGQGSGHWDHIHSIQFSAPTPFPQLLRLPLTCLRLQWLDKIRGSVALLLRAEQGCTGIPIYSSAASLPPALI